MENLTNKTTNWCVYMHEHRESGKKYIGITEHKPTKRWKNGEGYKQCPRFYPAIQEYGWDAFRHEILFTDLTKEEAEALEIELIAKYETQDPTKGYNVASGGPVNKDFHRSDEFKQKVSIARKGVYAGERHNMWGIPKSEETKERIRAAQIGVPKSAESCKKMSEGAKRRWGASNKKEREHLRELNLGGNNPRARAVKCLDTGVVYSAVREAGRETGVENSCIVRCCNGERQTAGGLRWAYADEAVVDRD